MVMMPGSRIERKEEREIRGERSEIKEEKELLLLLRAMSLCLKEEKWGKMHRQVTMKVWVAVELTVEVRLIRRQFARKLGLSLISQVSHKMTVKNKF
jgi:hypothetical protein